GRSFGFGRLTARTHVAPGVLIRARSQLFAPPCATRARCTRLIGVARRVHAESVKPTRTESRRRSPRDTPGQQQIPNAPPSTTPLQSPCRVSERGPRRGGDTRLSREGTHASSTGPSDGSRPPGADARATSSANCVGNARRNPSRFDLSARNIAAHSNAVKAIP